MQPRFTVSKDLSKAKPHLAAVSLELCYEIGEDTVEQVSETISAAEMSGQPYLPVYISSPGGCCYSAISIVNMLKACALPVWTVILSQASSAAAVVFSCGERRFAAPGAQLMIHEVSVGGGFSMTKSTDFENDAKHTRKLQRQLFKIMAENVGATDPKYFIELIKKKNNSDVWMDAEAMHQHKLLTDVGIPVMACQAKIEYTTAVRCQQKLKTKVSKKRKAEERGEAAPLKHRVKKPKQR